MRSAIRWIIIGTISFIVISLWAFIESPHAAVVRAIHRLLISGAGLAAVMAFALTPAWISMSCMLVKRAIKSAQNNNYNEARSYLFSRGWAIVPRPKYAEIVRILRHLCKDRKTKPPGMSPDFSKYIVLDDLGNYGLSLEGAEKMSKIVDRGWLTAKKAEDLASPKTFTILMWLVVAVAIIRVIILIISILSRH